MNTKVKVSGKYKYVETAPGKPVLLLLHGLFGALSNFTGIVNNFEDYNVVIPLLPIYDLDLDKTGLKGLVNFTKDFVEFKNYRNIHILGNSLGGHIAQLYVLECPDRICTMTLTGSSGLFESGLGDGYPRRGDYDYIKQKTSQTFYDPAIATKELVDEVYETVNNRNKAIRIIVTAKNALKHNLADRLHEITVPTLLVWGGQDKITPPFVGEKFNELIQNSEIVFVDKCGHAPMMERPEEFSAILSKFVNKHQVNKQVIE